MATYPIPPWIVPARPEELASLSAAAARSQAQLGMEQQRLNQAAVQNEITMQAHQIEQERSELMRKQQLAVQREYNRAQIGLRKQQIETANANLSFRVGQAARQFQARQNYQAEAQRLITEGVPENEAYSRAALKWGPEMGVSGGAGGLPKAITAPATIEEADYRGQPFVKVTQPTGTVALHPLTDVAARQREASKRSRLNTELRTLQASQKKIEPFAIAAGTKPEYADIRKQYDARQKQIDALKREIEGLEGGAPGAKKVGKFTIVSDE